jgi:hypothetical protein
MLNNRKVTVAGQPQDLDVLIDGELVYDPSHSSGSPNFTYAQCRFIMKSHN